MKYLALAVLFLAPVAQADQFTAKDVAQEIKQESVLSMTASVSLELANNLLAAQAASPWLNSLDLSIDAVLRAIMLYDFPGGPKSLTESCCEGVWAQSTIAIDTNAGVGLSPTALNFGEVVVTPEPATGLMLLAGAFLLSVKKSREQVA